MMEQTNKPYWFEEVGKTITVNAACYCDVFKNFYDDLSKILSEGQQEIAWFMQDGAPPHTAHDTISYLKEFFNSRLLALGTDHE